MKNSKRILEVDYVRGLAAILMILGHSFIEQPVDTTSVPICQYLEHFIYTFHMEAFFVCAGIVYRRKPYLNYIRQKAIRLLVPYAFFGALSLVLHVFAGSAVNGTVSLKEGITSFGLYGGYYWFLYTLFIVFLLYPIVDKLPSKAVVPLAILLIVVRQFVSVPRILTLNNVVHYLPYFILGNMITRINTTAPKNKSWVRQKLIVMALCFLAFAFVEIAELKYSVSVGAILSFIRAVSLISILFVLFHDISHMLKSKKELRLLIDCSKFSLQLYVFNGFILTVARIMTCSIMGIRSPFAIVVGIWLSNIIITLVACKWIIPHIPGLRFLCGIEPAVKSV